MDPLSDQEPSATSVATPAEVRTPAPPKKRTRGGAGVERLKPARRSRAHLSPVIVLVGDVVAMLALLPLTKPAYAVLSALIALTVLGLLRTYRRRLTLSALDDLPPLVIAVALATLGRDLLFEPHVGLLPTGGLALAQFGLLMLGRCVTYALIRGSRRRGTLSARTLVIGGGFVGARIALNAVEHRELGLEAVGIVDDNPLPETRSLNLPIISQIRPLSEAITALQVDTVIVAFSEVRDLDLLDTLRTCDRLDSELLVVPRLFELSSLTGDMELLRDMPLTRVRRAPYRTLEWRLKRLFDIAASASALIVLSPLLALIGATVWLSDRSAPVLFRQRRIGVDGTEFTVLKFRSFKPADEHESETRWTISDDARLGRLGRFLRKTYLDELPQLWNVLRGDMSVVGPRPERPYFAAEYAAAVSHYGARHRVPAGLTGWAAVHGLRGDTSVRDRAAYDNYYIENWSLWLDLKIVLRTVLAVLRRTGG